MTSPRSPQPASAIPVELPSSPSRILRLPWVKSPDVPLPRPTTRSGLFPEAPIVPERTGTGLRRAVLVTVVLGVIGLVGYASWQRVGHRRSRSAAAAGSTSAASLEGRDRTDR